MRTRQRQEARSSPLLLGAAAAACWPPLPRSWAATPGAGMRGTRCAAGAACVRLKLLPCAAHARTRTRTACAQGQLLRGISQLAGEHETLVSSSWEGSAAWLDVEGRVRDGEAARRLALLSVNQVRWPGRQCARCVVPAGPGIPPLYARTHLHTLARAHARMCCACMCTRRSVCSVRTSSCGTWWAAWRSCGRACCPLRWWAGCRCVVRLRRGGAGARRGRGCSSCRAQELQ